MSKNGASPLIRFPPVELETGRQGPFQPPDLFKGFFLASIARDFKPASGGNANFDLVAFFQIERLNHRGWKANRYTVSPFCDSAPNVYPALSAPDCPQQEVLVNRMLIRNRRLRRIKRNQIVHLLLARQHTIHRLRRSFAFLPFD